MSTPLASLNVRETLWYCADGDRVIGPFPWAQLRQRAGSGQLQPDDFVCPQGKETWVRAIALDGLFGHRDETVVQDERPTIPGYEIIGELGRGGAGVVYKARQLSLHRLVALKVLHAAESASAADVARLTTEARTLARLRHPHIVQIYDVGTHKSLTYLSLELVEGGNLNSHQDGKPLPPTEAAALLAVIARAVHFAHEQGIIHRDLKPANVLIVDCRLRSTDSQSQSAIRNLQSTIPKITDFGLAKDLGRVTQQTHPGTVMGTPCYMAPEQAGARSNDISPRTDVYALGVILYELLSGKPPFLGPPPVVLFNVLERDPPPLRESVPGLAPELEKICLRCLAKKPLDRPASALELAEALERWVASQQVVARRPRTKGSLVPWLVAVQVLTLLALAGLAWWSLRPIPPVAVDDGRQWREALAAERAERLDFQQRVEASLEERQTQRLLQAYHHASNGSRRTALLELAGLNTDTWEYRFVHRAIAAAAYDLPLQAAKITALACSADGSRFAIGLRDGTVKLYRSDTGSEVDSLSTGTSEVVSLWFSPEGQFLFIAAKEGQVVAWELRTGEFAPLDSRTTGFNDLITGNDRSTLWLRRSTSRSTLGFMRFDRVSRISRPITASSPHEMTALAFHPSMPLIVAGSTRSTTTSAFEYRLASFDLLQGALRPVEQVWPVEHTKPITSGAFSPDGKLVVSAS